MKLRQENLNKAQSNNARWSQIISNESNQMKSFETKQVKWNEFDWNQSKWNQMKMNQETEMKLNHANENKTKRN